MAREIIGARFHEIAVECDLATLRQRDPKGLYARADRAEITEFTGVSSPYETPVSPEFRVNTSQETLSQTTLSLWKWMQQIV
jgi:adenylylsulfate kinase-like enzyme